MAFLARYWRVLAIAAAVAGILILVTRCTEQAEQRGYNRATAEMAARVAKANAETAALEQRQRIQSERAAKSWESKRNALQSEVDRLVASRPVVRLCKPASAAPVPGTAESAGRIDDGAGRRIDALQAGPDVGLGLVQYGAECERIRQQLTGLQSWVSETLSPR